MATKVWRGDSPITREVYTLVVGGTVEIGDVFNVVINGKTAATSSTTTSTATTATEIEATCEARTDDEFEEVDWTVAGSTVTATGPSDGMPIIITGSTTEAGGGAADLQTFVITNTVEAVGPNDWNVAANWDASGVPGADTVWLKDSEINIKYGLAQAAVTLTALNSEASFTGDLGLPVQSEAGDYYEYRATYLAVSVTTWHHGRGDGDGSKRFKLDTGSNACTAHIWKTGSRVDVGVPACLWKGAHASNVITVHRGDVGIAFFPGEVATLPTLNVSYLENIDGDSNVVIGSGATITTITINGGVTTSFATATVTTVTMNGGTYIAYGGTITTLTINTDGEFDADQSDGNFTITNTIVMKAGSILRNRKRRINGGGTPVIQLSGCGLKDVTLDLGDNFTATIAYN